MFFVVWGHSFIKQTSFLRKYIYSFHMPLFFFLSGLTFKNEDMRFTKFVYKKFKALVIPYLILNAGSLCVRYVFYLFGLMKLLPIKNIFIGTLIANNNIYNFPSSHTWFLLTLFLLEILFYLIRRVCKDNKKVILVSIIFGICGYISSLNPLKMNLPLHLNVVLSAVVPFSLGYIYNKDKIPNIKHELLY